MFAPNVKKIVVNADDLGLSDGVNAKIFASINRGLITSASVLANGDGFDNFQEQFRAYSQASFGVHLNLTEGLPLTNRADLGPLLHTSGRFREDIRNVRNLGKLRSAIKEELSAQVSRLLEAGVKISHFDSHQHVHTIPAITPVVKLLQSEFGIRRIRRARNFYLGGKFPSQAMYLKKLAFNQWLRWCPSTRMVDGMGNADDFIISADQIPSKFKSIELETHPGAARGDEEMARLQCWIENDPTIQSRLVNYHEI